jgi:hypothetical protein
MNDELWFDRSTIAALLGIAPKTFDEGLRKRLPADAVRGAGRDLRFFAPVAVQALVAKRVTAAERTADPDPLMSGGSDSPQLERYRAANADLKEMERDRVRKSLIRVDELEPQLMKLADVLRGAGDHLVRRFGNDAGQIITEAIDEYEAGLKTMFGTDDDLRRGGEGEGVPV